MVNIALQVFERKIKSPLSAAFDLKLECYLKEHQNKWSKDKEQLFAPIQFPDEWHEWILKQLQFYKDSFSSYKVGVAILPSYARLSADDFRWLGEEPLLQKGNIALTRQVTPSKRIVAASKLPAGVFAVNPTTWQEEMYSVAVTDEEKFKYFPTTLPTWRLSVSGSYKSGFYYLLKNFGSLLSQALGNDSKKELYRTLFCLLQNDAYPDPKLYELIALLVFTANYPQYFSVLKTWGWKNSFEAIIKVGEFLRPHKKDLENVALYLIQPASFTEPLKIIDPLAADHIAIPVDFVIAPIPLETEFKHPLGRMTAKYFTKTEVPIASNEFALSLSGLPNATLIEKRLIEHYQKGHEQNKNKKKPVYEARKEVELTGLKNELEKLKKDDWERLAKLENALLVLANQTAVDHPQGSEKAKAYNLLMARASEQKKVITISDLFTAFLHKDPSLLTAQNPFLTQEAISQLFADLSGYALLHSRVDQINAALEIIAEMGSFNELYKQQLLASVLDKQRAYQIAEFPEFLVYEYATKRLLRQDQVDNLIKIFKLIESDLGKEDVIHHGLLQFAAGGGKTSVLIPILAFRFACLGFLPVIFNTSELYPIGFEDIPLNLRASFQQNMEVVERELDHVWTPAELKKLLTDLKRWRSEKKCLLLQAVTWHSINLAMKLAYVQRTDNWLESKAVLDFFKRKCVKLEDECQVISTPMQQSIKTFGKMQKISDPRIQLLLHFYDYLFDIGGTSADIAKLAGIKAREVIVVSPNDLLKLQKRLGEEIAKDPTFKEISTQDLILYLTQPERKKPQWLLDLYDKRIPNPNSVFLFDPAQLEKKLRSRTKPDFNAVALANLVVLARAFIHTHLPFILSLQYKKDYGVSIHPGDLTVAPKHESKDVKSHYGDHTLVAALTMQLYLLKGLLPDQVEQLLNQFLGEHHDERKWNVNTDVPTQAEQWLMQWIPKQYSFGCARDLTPQLKKELSMDRQFFENPHVVKVYLLKFALPQIRVPQDRQSSTAAELQAGFDRSCGFSATPPTLFEALPAFVDPENCFLEEAFEAQVIETLLQIQNRGLCILTKQQNPTQFFDQFPPELLTKMTTLIDRGALLTDFEAADIIASYFGLGIARTPTQTAAFFSKENLHLQFKKSDTLQDIKIRGAGLVDALKKRKIKPEQFLLFLFLDLSKTTGTDIKRPPTDHAGLTVGKGQTVTETIQAAMRERQLLDDNAQSITWLIFQSLYREINPTLTHGVFDPRQLFYWMIKNEAKEIESQIIERAYQGIDQAIRGAVWSIPKSIDDDGYVNCLKQTQDIDPWDIYEIDSQPQQTEIVLRRYVEALINSLPRAAQEHDFPDQVMERVEKIISQTVALVAFLQDPPKKAVNTEVQQEMQTAVTLQQEQQQQQNMKKRIDGATDFIFAMERYSIELDNLAVIFDPIAREASRRYQRITLPACETFKMPDLLFSRVHFVVLQQAEAKTLQTLKPIKMLLVQITPDKKIEYLACTAAGSEYFSLQLNNKILQENDKAYAIITIEGDILCMSMNLNYQTCKELLARDESQQMLVYAHFLNGIIYNPAVLSQLIEKLRWTKTQYETVALSISSLQVSVSSASLLDNSLLKQLCGWADTESPIAADVSSRYIPPKPSTRIRVLRTLQAPEVLDKPVHDLLPSIPSPKRALEGYVFGVAPVPVATRGEELNLEHLIKDIRALTNKNKIIGKDRALIKLNDWSLMIINSLQSTADKMKAVTELLAQFEQLDGFLEALHSHLKRLPPCKESDQKSEILKQVALKAIMDAYLHFSQGWTTAACKQELKEVLREVAVVSVEKSSKRMTFFGTPQLANQLADALNTAATALEEQRGTTQSTSPKKE